MGKDINLWVRFRERSVSVLEVADYIAADANEPSEDLFFDPVGPSSLLTVLTLM